MSAVEMSNPMAGRKVQSKAGEIIEILSDEDWADLTESNVASVRKPFRSKLGLVRALWHHGTFRSANGRATIAFHSIAEQYGYLGSAVAISGAVNDPLNVPAFSRQTKGKRTYAISLVALPETWYKRMLEIDELDPDPEPDEPEPIPEPSQGDRDAAEAVAELVMPEPDGLELVIDLPEYVPPPEPELEPSPLLEVSATVAMALLTQVVEIISAGSPEQTDQRVRKLSQDVSDLADKLAKRLTENDSLRRKARELGDELNAVKYERDGLRTRLRMTEHNLSQALKSDVMAQVNERVMRELEKVMRVVPSPSPRKGDPK